MKAVQFDDYGGVEAFEVRTYVRDAGVAADFAQCTPLAKQIPTLVVPDLDRFEPTMLVRAQPALARTNIETVLLGHELLDAVRTDADCTHVATLVE